ncbi:hypothetical protein [Streptomyces sp. NRRL S-495]|uniref:hypothetical protein n=1 Tax=Streptomyces sp. NRRL S-495 TaxID=1609133 RepID=UPI0005F8FA09|nr:hypothetical protein [Streptomyces sp. NRRL S-495]KJY30116.1 hypothetical protein VR45_28430 [Streptomyces sp. NRRL S-495]
MGRPFFFKQPFPVAVAALVVGATAAMGVPALADGQDRADTHRSVRAAVKPDLVIDSVAAPLAGGAIPDVGVPYATKATFKATRGSDPGTAYGLCTKMVAGAEADSVYCTLQLKFDEGSELAIAVLASVAHEGVKLKEFTGSVVGGTLRFADANGNANFSANEDAGYDLMF